MSDNDEIVTVDGNGVLHGVSLGTATITATSHNGIEKKCSVTVTNAAERVEVAPVDAEAAEVATGAGLLLGAVAYGKDDVTEDVAQTFTWTSSNISIATVEAGEGGEATIRGIRPGTVTITATVTDGTGVQGTCPVKVIVAVRDFTIPETAYVVMDAEMTLPLSVSLTMPPTSPTRISPGKAGTMRYSPSTEAASSMASALARPSSPPPPTTASKSSAR